VTPRAYADAVAFVDLSAPAWLSGPALWVLGMPLALGLARTVGAATGSAAGTPALHRAPRYLLGAGILCGVALLAINLSAAPYDRLHRRVVRAVETVDLGGTGDARATLRLVSAEFLRGVRTSLPEAPLLDLRATTRTLPVAMPPSLDAAAVPVVTVEKPETGGGDYVRDLRVVALPPVTLERARITVRSIDTLKMLDDGVWIARNEFVRSGAFSETFRLSGRQGQTVEIEIRLDFAEDILGARVAADDAVVHWSASIAWRGTVTL
jgi:hypothetical protein